MEIDGWFFVTNICLLFSHHLEDPRSATERMISLHPGWSWSIPAHRGDSATFSWPCFLTSSRVCIFWVWGVCLLSLCGGAAAVTDAVVGMYSERPSLGIVVMLLLTGGKNTVFNRKALFSWTIYSNCCRKYIKDAKEYCCCRNRNDEKRSL